MYEILKQYEKVGERTITLQELRELIGVADKEYPRWDNFKARVLDSCQQALKDYTDICFTYEPVRRGKGGKVTAFVFRIAKNKDYVDRLSLDEFIDVARIHADGAGESLPADEAVPELPEQTEEDPIEKFQDESLAFLAEACEFEFDEAKMRVIKDKLLALGYVKIGNEGDLERYRILREKYHELNAYDNIPKDSHKRRYGLLTKYLLSDE